MRKKNKFSISSLLALVVAVLSFGIHTTSSWAEGLTKVESKYVCMVNNDLYPKEQISIVVQGKTYYGCCEMCKEKLANSEAARNAIDPVSKKAVDEANAVIGATGAGKVFYFENTKNLEQFSSPG